MEEYIIRFFAGAFLVSIFSCLGDVLHPKTFAGLFGAAPSIAIAALLTTYETKGATVVVTEARSMVIGSARAGQASKHSLQPIHACISCSTCGLVLCKITGLGLNIFSICFKLIFILLPSWTIQSNFLNEIMELLSEGY